MMHCSKLRRSCEPRLSLRSFPAIRNGGTRVHLKGYGFILVFRIDTPDGDTE